MPTNSPPRIAHVEDAPSFLAAAHQLEADYPDLILNTAEVSGESCLRSEQGGMRVFWLYRGKGAILLPERYRTQEGDGHSLPKEYLREPMGSEFAAMLDTLDRGYARISEAAAPHVRLILDRRSGSEFAGDIAAYLWGLEHAPRPWSREPQVEETLTALFGIYREQGHSVKQTASWEPIMTGDQIALCGDEEVRVRGEFACMSIEKKDRTERHISTARRLRYLLDTAGGGSFDF